MEKQTYVFGGCCRSFQPSLTGEGQETRGDGGDGGEIV